MRRLLVTFAAATACTTLPFGLASCGREAAATATPTAAPTKTAPIDIQNLFYATGWMGDGEYRDKFVSFNGADRSSAHSAPDSIRVTYTFGPKRFAGVYFQNQPDNWGDKPGADFSGQGLTKVTFWARGAVGGETVEFKVGGIDAPGKPYRDSLLANRGRITLEKDWRQYEIPLSAASSLKSVIGGFCAVISASYNTDTPVTFYLDDIVMQ